MTHKLTAAYRNAAEVYHRISLTGRKSLYSAWFDKDGGLLDAERKDAAGRFSRVTDKEWAALQRGGWSAKQHTKFSTH